MPRQIPAAITVIVVAIATACTGQSSASPSPPAPSGAAPTASGFGLTASPSPTTLATETPAPSPSGPAAPTISSVPSIPASHSPTPAADSPSPAGASFPLHWQRREDDFGAGISIEGSAVLDDRIVLVGNELMGGEDGFRAGIWWENGDLVWREADLPDMPGVDPWLSAVAPGGPGLVAVGTYFDADDHLRALVLLSADGKTWQAADAPALDDGLWNATHYGTGATLAAVDGGLILVGRIGEEGGTNIAFVSVDGREWQRTADPAGDELAYGHLLSGSQPLTGFASRLEPCCDGDVTGNDPVWAVGPVRVWQAAGPDKWTKVGEVPGASGSQIYAGAVGPRGWVAVGGGAWTSSDGRDWQPAQTAPDGDVCAMFGVQAGFVAVGTNDYCGEGSETFTTQTWTSVDGTDWRMVDTLEGGGLIRTLRRRGDTLIGIGALDGITAAVWTAELP